jgi:hypothetical protein
MAAAPAADPVLAEDRSVSLRTDVEFARALERVKSVQSLENTAKTA